LTNPATTIARASYQRCQQAPQFFETFYRYFFEACPATPPMFAGTDFARQHKLLQHAIGLLLSFDQETGGEPNLLTRVAERHGRQGLNVDRTYYGGFLDSLIRTAREFDPEFTDETERAWRVATAKGIAYMQSKS
jgi:hemoglobin-like flavoprotein